MDDDKVYQEDLADDSSLHIAVCLDPRDPSRAARTSRAWLRPGWEGLFGEVARAVARGDPDIDASLAVCLTERDSLRGRPMSEERWAAAQDAIDRNPVLLKVYAWVHGKRLSYSEVRHAVTRVVDDNPWVRLVSRAMLGRMFDSAVEYDRWVDFLTEVLADADPAYGEISHDGGDDLFTELDRALKRKCRTSIEQSRSLLRGYSWVTVVPQELVNRLGGVSAIEAAGAVAEVRRLPGGGVLLRATRTPDEYDDDAMRRVFLLLTPVLPAGQPRTLPGWPTKHQVVYEDAANYRE